MRFWRTVLVLAFATLWVAAGQHCRLELLSGFEFLSCCHHPEAETTSAHHQNEGADDGCAAVESGFYKQARPQTPPVKPLLAWVAWLVPLPEDGWAGASPSLLSSSTSPPELGRLWRFSQRAARPPRAPTIVS